MHLYETHLPVADTKITESFYREVVGLPMAHRDTTRDIVFLWADEKQKGMIGLWGANTGYGRQKEVLTRCHLAFAVSFEELQRAIIKLNERGIETSGSGGKPTTELSVIGWMPSAQIYFRDPDAHSLEFIAILPEAPNASFVGSYSDSHGKSRKMADMGSFPNRRCNAEQTGWNRDDNGRCATPLLPIPKGLQIRRVTPSARG